MVCMKVSVLALGEDDPIDLDIEHGDSVADVTASIAKGLALPTEWWKTQQLVYYGRTYTLQDKTKISGSDSPDLSVKDGSLFLLTPILKDTNTSVELDLVFVIDTTGSMGSCINHVCNNVKLIVSEIIAAEGADVRFGLVEYKDVGDFTSTGSDYYDKVARKYEFTKSLEEMKSKVSALSPTGGADYPEAVASGFKLLNTMQFRSNATKVVVHVADAPPHGCCSSGDSYPSGDPKADLMEESHNILGSGARIYSVGCGSVDNAPMGYNWMRWLAHRSNGTFVWLDNINLLARIIVAGCRTELAIDRAYGLVKDEYPDVVTSPSDIISNSEIMSSLVDMLQKKKLKFLELNLGAEPIDEEYIVHSQVFDSVSTLAQAQKGISAAFSGKRTYKKNTISTEVSVSVSPFTAERVKEIILKRAPRVSVTQSSETSGGIISKILGVFSQT